MNVPSMQGIAAGVLMVLSFCSCSPVRAQQPDDTQPALPKPELPLPPSQMPDTPVAPPIDAAVPPHDDVRSRIREALDAASGGRNTLQQNPSSQPRQNDPLLEGVLEAIRQRGSVLEESPLADGPPADRTSNGNGNRSDVAVSEQTTADARLAELLLKSARLLEQRASRTSATGYRPDPALVRRLRSEAATILITLP